MSSQPLSPLTKLWHMHQLKLQFLLVGAAVFIIDAALFYLLLQQFNLALLPARATAFLIAVLLSWAGNRCWTFRARQQVPKVQQLFISVLVSSIAAVVNMSVFYGVSQLLGQTMLGVSIAFSVGVLAGLILNWLGANFWTFRPVIDE